MHVTFRIRRFDPARPGGPWWQEYPVEAPEGAVVLQALHGIHERVDGTLAFRYSCRGAICGSCACRINGRAALTCKTQVSAIAKDGDTITLEPLLNEPVIKDLVVEQEPFFREMRKAAPHLIAERTRAVDEPVDYRRDLSEAEFDQWNRATDCIRCQACFSDCPKRLQAPTFIGPQACVEAFKRVYDPRDTATARRLAEASAPGGIFDCDRHGNCVKVCPKDVRPMRAIMMLRRKAKETQRRP